MERDWRSVSKEYSRIQVCPARLHEGNAVIFKIWEDAFEEIRPRNKICIKDGNELSASLRQSIREGASFVSMPAGAM